MRKSLQKSFAIALLAIMNISIFAQNQVEIEFTKNRPIIDGKIDTSWNIIPKHDIDSVVDGDVSFSTTPSWQAMWNNEKIYVLVTAPDNDFYLGYEANLASYNADLIELYFDVNDTIKEGKGAKDSMGHYQMAPELKNNPTDYTNPLAINVTADSTGYYFEYSIPSSRLADKYGKVLDPFQKDTIGFDITILDLDEERKGLTTTMRGRLNWSNEGEVNESWNSMDNSGWLIFANKFLSENGTYMSQLFNVQGCDSVVSLALTIKEEITTTVEQEGLTLTAKESDASYQWVKCGDTQEPIDGATKQAFTATENGDYAVIITLEYCSETSECVSIVGIRVNDKLNQDAINLYPNPVNNILNISIDATIQTASIEIYNSMGQLVITDSEFNSNSITINTKSLTQGIYLVHLILNNQAYSYQIVK